MTILGFKEHLSIINGIFKKTINPTQALPVKSFDIRWGNAIYKSIVNIAYFHIMLLHAQGDFYILSVISVFIIAYFFKNRSAKNRKRTWRYVNGIQRMKDFS